MEDTASIPIFNFSAGFEKKLADATFCNYALYKNSSLGNVDDFD